MIRRFQTDNLNNNSRKFPLNERKEGLYFKEQFPYDEIPRIIFDDNIVLKEPLGDIFITDTTFRDGQQARPPYTPQQIEKLFDLMHKLGGPNGVIRQSEFFIYSKRDREALDRCRALGHQFPEITGWIRANSDDLNLVKKLNIKETGILTSVSDYHIYLKLGITRRKAMEKYLYVVKEALNAGIKPRCHFEDITRADIYGFCLPFAEELLKLSEESGIPVKIRLCDTMGYGITYPQTILPRSVPRLAHAFHKELGYPSELLEWHGHNDFHKVHINGATAWLHGISALNASLFGIGERTGNPPMESAIIEYIALKGENNGIDTTIITELADYFRKEIHGEIPSNFPFIGSNFNTTRAGIHADGILKNEKIYNIFDTEKLLNRPIRVTVTDKSGVAGIAQWINENIESITTGQHEPISKRLHGVRRIYEWVIYQYEQGRTTGISPDELITKAKHHLPFLFDSEFTKLTMEAQEIANTMMKRVYNSEILRNLDDYFLDKFLSVAVRREPSIQLITMANLNGERIGNMHTHHGQKGRFRRLKNKEFMEHRWFSEVKKTGKSHHSEPFVSMYTDEFLISAGYPIFNPENQLIAVLNVDFLFAELVKLHSNIPLEILEVSTRREEHK